MPTKYDLHRYSPFVFQTGLDEVTQHLVERVNYGNRMLTSMPTLKLQPSLSSKQWFQGSQALTQ